MPIAALLPGDLMTYLVSIGGVDHVLDSERERFTIEQQLGAIGRATITLWDPDGTIEVGDRMNVTVRRDTTNVYRGQVLSRSYRVFGPSGRYIDIDCSDYNTLLDERLVGVAGGDFWEGPDENGNYRAATGGYTQSTDKTTIAYMFDMFVANPSIGHNTYVNEYVPDTILGSNIIYFDRTTVRGVFDQLAGLGGGATIVGWIDADLEFHWQLIPDALTVDPGAEPIVRGLADPVVLTAAPIGFSVTPDGVTTKAANDPGPTWSSDASQMPQDVYVVGATDFGYSEGGRVSIAGTGWISGLGIADASKRQLLLSTDARTQDERDAYGNAVLARSTRGRIRGSLKYVGEELFALGTGLYVNYPQLALPVATYAIQSTRMDWTLGVLSWELGFGDAPPARFSSRAAPAALPKPPRPASTHEIAVQHLSPVPGSTWPYYGAFMNPLKTDLPVAGLPLIFTLNVWDQDGNVVTGVGTVTALTTVTDRYGQWSCLVTYGPQANYEYELIVSTPDA